MNHIPPRVAHECQKRHEVEVNDLEQLIMRYLLEGDSRAERKGVHHMEMWMMRGHSLGVSLVSV